MPDFQFEDVGNTRIVRPTIGEPLPSPGQFWNLGNSPTIPVLRAGENYFDFIWRTGLFTNPNEAGTGDITMFFNPGGNVLQINIQPTYRVHRIGLDLVAPTVEGQSEGAYLAKIEFFRSGAVRYRCVFRDNGPAAAPAQWYPFFLPSEIPLFQSDAGGGTARWVPTATSGERSVPLRFMRGDFDQINITPLQGFNVGNGDPGGQAVGNAYLFFADFFGD